MIDEFLSEVIAHDQLSKRQSQVESDLLLNKFQIGQLEEELEYYFRRSQEQEKMIDTMTDYLSNDRLLKIARQVHRSQ